MFIIALSVVVRVYNPSYLGDKGREAEVGGQLSEANLSKVNARPYL
jgi:hypothetical protein